MRIFSFLISLCYLINGINGQCPPETELLFTSQSKLEQFRNDYPNCDHYDGDIEVFMAAQDSQTDPIVDLSPLSNLITVSGYFAVRSDIYENLVSLSGLNLRRVYELRLQYLPLIESLEGLETLDTIDILRINNTAIVNNLHLDAFVRNIIRIEDNPFMRRIGDLIFKDTSGLNVILENNPALTSFGNIEKLTWIDYLQIENLGNYDFVEQFVRLQRIYLAGDNELVDLSKFSNLESISSSIQLKNLSNFKSLLELPNIPSFRLYLDNCPIVNLEGLTNVNERLLLGLVNMTQIEDISQALNINKLGELQISNCPNISDLKGFGNLVELERIYIKAQNFTSLEGLENLRVLEGLTLVDNKSLANIFALSFIQLPLERIIITGNDKLDDCNIIPVCNSLDQATVENNGIHCSDEVNLLKECGLSRPVKIFYDENMNGMYESETGIPQGQFIDNSKRKLFPDSKGIIEVFSNGIPLEYQYTINNRWEITTGASDFIFDSNSGLDTTYIGVAPLFEISDYDVFISTSPIICDKEYFYDVTIINNGTTNEVAELKLLGFGDVIGADYPYQMIGDSISMIFENVVPGYSKSVRLVFQAPSIVDVTIGEEITHSLTYKIYDDILGTVLSDSIIFSDTFLCSYDPNDKQVSPRSVDNNYVEIDHKDFIYNIRFQNTGNYFAQNLSITDTLSDLLDPSTFSFIGSSHGISEIIQDSFSLSFVFNNIMLPDSTRNPEGSNGYVTFYISAKPNIIENDILENTAYIYFDNNPGIVTNSTRSVFKNLSTSIDPIPDEQISILLFPTITENEIRIESTEQVIDKEISIYNCRGLELHRQRLPNSGKVDVSGLESGLYYLRVMNSVEKFIKL